MKTDLSSQGIPLDSLINEGQYARLAKFLMDLQNMIEPEAQSNIENLTTTALQICMFCLQCQAEMEWHRKADQEVRLRLNELNAQLDILLNSIIEYKTRTGTNQPDVSVSVTLLEDRVSPMVGSHPNLWQRIRSLFNFKTRHPDSKRQITKFVVNTSFPVGVEKGDRETYRENSAKNLRSTLTTLADTVDPAIAPSFHVPDAIRDVESVKQAKTPAASISDREQKDASVTPIQERSKNLETPPSLVVYCLGPFRVYQNDQLITEWQSLKSQAILKYLLSNSGAQVPKNILMDIFWPDSAPEAARRNLHQAIYSLRQELKGGQPEFQHIRFENDRYFLNPKINIWLDFNEFEKYVNAGYKLQANGNLAEAIKQYGIAEGLYQGEFLEDDLYEDWLQTRRLHFHNMYMDITDRLSRYYLQNGEYIATIALCRKLLDKDNCHEGSHRRLMKCFLAQGQRHMALRQYQTCIEVLHKELDIEPAGTTIALYEYLRCKET